MESGRTYIFPDKKTVEDMMLGNSMTVDEGQIPDIPEHETNNAGDLEDMTENLG